MAKPMQKDGQVKAHIKAIIVAQKEIKTHAKTVDGQVKAAATAYGEIK